ncbi:Na+/H+ antiporter subunit A [Hoyosella rhizosphaerae]|uniref:Cation antiporter NADH dehydrogenase subunit n=1 Tax=Hoyosella rhizosphaerae TaxID=1755582 RepID=A0A916U751_9ACTN|nr:Na+/H+ antiporter subunit A [Hoyosella rhizosphaerae]MBN4927783.1 Na+/H+ antiporter subunit A [Hoyosella rhizosphaerae]GGC61571.1 putative cation antiporter NADH dehydrogenase subunit [Hoyosella rhizosphaerae]
MIAVLVAHALAALIAPLLVRNLGRNAFLVLAVVPFASFLWVLANFTNYHRVSIPWAPELGMDIELWFDGLTAIMACIVLGIGALVLVYCARYFPANATRLGSFSAYLVAFAGAMFGIITSDNMLVLFIFWEATTVLSFLLVGYKAEKLASRKAATKALLVTTFGGLAMLVGIIMLGQSTGSYLISDLLANPPQSSLVDVALVLILVGALSKSAIIPLHFWLPAAMAAPTPVSAYLHAAAMVKAGVFIVARLSPAFADASPWRALIISLGALSMVLAGWRALREFDLKLILAFGTVSQLGFLMILAGLGTRHAALAAIALVVAHAMFKGTLFLVVGVIDRVTGTRDIRKLSGLGRRAPVLAAVSILAAASMAGLPPFLGFYGKETALTAISETAALSPTLGLVTLATVVLGSIFTVAYSLRFISGAFSTKRGISTSPAVVEMKAPSALFLFSPAVLSVSGLVAGFLTANLVTYSLPYIDAFPVLGEGVAPKLGGSELALALSVLAIAGGATLFFADPLVTRWRSRKPILGNADRVYDATLRGVDEVSQRVTGFTQRGSLPFTQAIILATLIGLPTLALVLWPNWSLVHDGSDESVLQLAVGLIMVAAAIAATVMRNRLTVVLLIGITGYGTAVLFGLHGAPDLALTQVVVETLTLVIFILLLRKLPAEPHVSRMMGHRLVRAALGAGAGIMIVVVGLLAVSARSVQPVGAYLPDLAYSEGNGANVVNVVLVDIRAWDTFGEISVLLVAATGVASLIFRNRRFGSAPRVSDAPDMAAMPSRRHLQYTEIVWLKGSELRNPRNRSLILEVTTRLLFPVMMVLSVYFLFAGHNAPGGGFAGGLVAGLALVLRYLAGGKYELGESIPVDAGKILGLGLGIAACAALASMFFGAPVLSSATFYFDVFLFGEIKLVTALFFDIGVYLLVIGLVVDVLRSLGARLDSRIEVTQQ